MSEYSKGSLFYDPTAAELEEMLAQWDARAARRKETEDQAYDAYVKAMEQNNKRWEEQQARAVEEMKAGQRRRKAEQKQREEQWEWWATEWERRAEASRLAREERIKTRLGLTKERRSRIDWNDLIDDDLLVERQVGWERNQTALAMRKAGLTFREIGEKMGVTIERARQMHGKAKRTKGLSPVENYLNREWQPIALVADHGRPARRRMHKTLSVFSANPFWINGELDGRI